MGGPGREGAHRRKVTILDRLMAQTSQLLANAVEGDGDAVDEVGDERTGDREGDPHPPQVRLEIMRGVAVLRDRRQPEEAREHHQTVGRHRPGPSRRHLGRQRDRHEVHRRERVDEPAGERQEDRQGGRVDDQVETREVRRRSSCAQNPPLGPQVNQGEDDHDRRRPAGLRRRREPRDDPIEGEGRPDLHGPAQGDKPEQDPTGHDKGAEGDLRGPPRVVHGRQCATVCRHPRAQPVEEESLSLSLSPVLLWP